MADLQVDWKHVVNKGCILLAGRKLRIGAEITSQIWPIPLQIIVGDYAGYPLDRLRSKTKATGKRKKFLDSDFGLRHSV